VIVLAIMPDDKSKTRPQDAERVNVHEEYEVKYRCGKYGCTPEQLKAAVKKVGQGCREGVEGQVAETRRGVSL
jgi:hypothetical protein